MITTIILSLLLLISVAAFGVAHNEYYSEPLIPVDHGFDMPVLPYYQWIYFEFRSDPTCDSSLLDFTHGVRVGECQRDAIFLTLWSRLTRSIQRNNDTVLVSDDEVNSYRVMARANPFAVADNATSSNDNDGPRPLPESLSMDITSAVGEVWIEKFSTVDCTIDTSDGTIGTVNVRKELLGQSLSNDTALFTPLGWEMNHCYENKDILSLIDLKARQNYLNWLTQSNDDTFGSSDSPPTYVYPSYVSVRLMNDTFVQDPFIVDEYTSAHLSGVSYYHHWSYLEPSPNATTCYADNMKVSNFSEVRGKVCVSWDGWTSYYYDCRLPAYSRDSYTFNNSYNCTNTPTNIQYDIPTDCIASTSLWSLSPSMAPTDYPDRFDQDICTQSPDYPGDVPTIFTTPMPTLPQPTYAPTIRHTPLIGVLITFSIDRLSNDTVLHSQMINDTEIESVAMLDIRQRAEYMICSFLELSLDKCVCGKTCVQITQQEVSNHTTTTNSGLRYLSDIDTSFLLTVTVNVTLNVVDYNYLFVSSGGNPSLFSENGTTTNTTNTNTTSIYSGLISSSDGNIGISTATGSSGSSISQSIIVQTIINNINNKLQLDFSTSFYYYSFYYTIYAAYWDFFSWQSQLTTYPVKVISIRGVSSSSPSASGSLPTFAPTAMPTTLIEDTTAREDNQAIKALGTTEIIGLTLCLLFLFFIQLFALYLCCIKPTSSVSMVTTPNLVGGVDDGVEMVQMNQHQFPTGGHGVVSSNAHSSVGSWFRPHRFVIVPNDGEPYMDDSIATTAVVEDHEQPVVPESIVIDNNQREQTMVELI